MGLLDRIIGFFFPRRDLDQEKDEDEEGITGAPISQAIIYQRKIIKPKASEKRGNKAVKLFAVTFEDNFTDRSEELAREILRYAETHNVHLEPDIQQLIGGYDDQEEHINPPFKYPVIEVGTE